MDNTPKLKLAVLSDAKKTKVKSKRMVVIYTSDGEEHVYDMGLWKLVKANDWVELRKIDKKEIVVFYYVNVMKIWQYITDEAAHPTIVMGTKGA